MKKVKDIIALANSLAPQVLAYNWDNTGLQIGNVNQDVSGILLTLDINKSVIDEAIAKNCELIISHHPLIFKPIKKIDQKDYLGKLIYKIIANKLNVFSMHTNLDKAEDGINDYLADLLGLVNIKPLNSTENRNDSDYSPGRIAHLCEEVPFRDFLRIVKKRLNIEQMRYVGEDKNRVRCIAICSGSGSDFIPVAAKEGADILITADIKYHQAQEAEVTGLGLIEAGHYQTE